jgi:hypothetical protein
VKLITTHRLSLLAFVPRRRFHLDVSAVADPGNLTSPGN